MSAKLYTLLLTCLLIGNIPLSHAETVYGRELMSEEEMNEHRNKMRSLETEQEREAYRMEHHKLMQERAKERGVTLPDTPSPRGKGMGMGKGQGMGKGRDK